MVQQPFWEKEYLADTHFAFGNPSEEVVEWVKKLPADARILDIGCGDGRHAVYLAQLGFKVEAIDISEAGIAKINRYKASHQLHNLQADVQDIITYQFSDTYDCIISHTTISFFSARRLASHYSVNARLYQDRGHQYYYCIYRRS